MDEILNYQALGKRIRNKRKYLRLTQEQFSKELGISTSFLGHIERGSRKASMATLVNICRMLHTMPNDLLYDSMGWMHEEGRSVQKIVADPFEEMHALIETIEAKYKAK